MALTRLYVDVQPKTCDHVKITVSVDSAHTQIVDEFLITFFELKQELVDEKIEIVKQEIFYIIRKTLGNNPSATKVQLRTAIEDAEYWSY